MQRNDITFSNRSVENLTTLIMYGNLITLDLSYNNLGDSGLKILSKGLAGKITLLKVIMIQCKITVQGANTFFQSLGSNASIKELCFDQNKIGSYQALRLVNETEDRPFIESIQSFFTVNHTLKTLSLVNCGFQDDSIVPFFLGLKQNSSLKKLNLCQN